MTDIKEEYHLKNISGSDAKRILEIADREDIDVEAIIDFIRKLKGVKKEMVDQKKDEERFSKEEAKVEKYLEDHKSENLTYRQAVLACLDKSEENREEYTEEEKKEMEKYDQKQEEDIKKVEDYRKKFPGTSFRDAAKIVLNRGELTKKDQAIEDYQAEHKCDYRTAVLAVLDKSEPEPEKEE